MSLSLRALPVGLLVLLPLAGCSARPGTEGSDPSGHSGEDLQSISLLWEGTCQFLACNSGYSTTCNAGDSGCYNCGGKKGYKSVNLACGETCTDDTVYLVSPTRMCGSAYVVCYGGTSANAVVMDSADSHHNWEASTGLLDALGAPHGTVSAHLYSPGDPAIQKDPMCGIVTCKGDGG